MDFTKIKSVKEYIREQEEEEAKKVQDEMDDKLEALFLTGEPVTDETLQVFADENSVDVEIVKNKIFGLVTTLLTTRDEEETEEEAPVDEAVVSSDTTEDEMGLGDEEELTEDDESATEEDNTETDPVNDEEVDDAAPESDFDIGDKVSFEVENEEHPLASMSLEVIDTDGDFVQCLAENPETGVQSTYWFKSAELTKIPNAVEVNPEGGDVENVEQMTSPADEYSSVQKESISDIIRKNLQLFKG